MTQPDPHSVGRLWIEEGDHQTGSTATVAPEAPIDKVYTYAVGPELVDRLQLGQRVRVPFGRRGRLVPGFCVGLGEEPWHHSLRQIDGLIDDESYLTPDLLGLGRWLGKHYCCPLGLALSALVPEAVRKKSGFVTVRLARLSDPPSSQGDAPQRVGAKSAALLDVLRQADGPLETGVLLERADTTASTLRACEKKGWIEVLTERRARPAPRLDTPRTEPGFELNEAQKSALDRINQRADAGTFSVTLLFGVSGSGKTEVYIRAMRRMLERGRQVIMLVPEIALTTQLVQRLASRFKNVAVFHSGLTGVERSLTWREVRSGVQPVIIGTRSAVFAPCPNPGLIVVDEEQEPSYKNLQAPRFHVRDVAIKRAQMAGIPVLLGSATPSLETWHNCTRLEHYERVDLPTRVRNLPLPKVEIVDMRPFTRSGDDGPALARVTRQKVADTLERGEQSVILINRRGFASVIWCPVCRWRLRCPHCNVGMVFHASRQRASCHHCRARITVPERCPNVSCQTPVVQSGAGTQKIEQELTDSFPDARIARADSDTMKRGRDYQDMVDRFGSREIDILLGTQMIGKGLDFPHVSFVGMIAADLAGAASDFRASERLFQLITQVAGRAGRERSGGEVVVQTLVPEVLALQASVNHDYVGFAEHELATRRQLGMPPFTRLTRFVFADAREREARIAAERFADDLRNLIAELELEGTDLLGPQPCSIERLRGLYRYDLLLRATRTDAMQQIIDRYSEGSVSRPKVRSFVVDVDPLAMS